MDIESLRTELNKRLASFKEDYPFAEHVITGVTDCAFCFAIKYESVKNISDTYAYLAYSIPNIKDQDVDISIRKGLEGLKGQIQRHSYTLFLKKLFEENDLEKQLEKLEDSIQ